MAKNKQNKIPKPDNAEKINQTVQQFQSLSNNDKMHFLQRAGVFYLSWQGRLISPTPELRGLVNQVSRLANITNLLFDRVTKRQADVSALSVVSEEEIQRRVTTPAVQAITDKVREISDVLDREQEARGGRRRGRQGQQNQGQQSDSDTDQSTADNGAEASSNPGAESQAESPVEESVPSEDVASEEDEGLDEPISG